MNPLQVKDNSYYRELHICELPITPLRQVLKVRDILVSLLPKKRSGWVLIGSSQGLRKECKGVLA